MICECCGRRTAVERLSDGLGGVHLLCAQCSDYADDLPPNQGVRLSPLPFDYCVVR